MCVCVRGWGEVIHGGPFFLESNRQGRGMEMGCGPFVLKINSRGPGIRRRGWKVSGIDMGNFFRN